MTDSARTRIIGLTGGTGSGKSAAAARFQTRGIPAIDADRVGHDVLAEDEAVRRELRAAYGDRILTDGAVDRDKLGPLVFADSEARLNLNRLVHPRILSRLAKQVAAYSEQGCRAVLIDAALIAESGRKDPWLDAIVLVLSAEDNRIRRLVELRGLDEQEARRRMQAQTPPESKEGAATWIIRNDGTLEDLYRQVDAVAEAILKM